jgi:hypothetical protein
MEKEERKKQSSLGSGHWVIKIFFKFPRAGITFFGGGFGSGLSDVFHHCVGRTRAVNFRRLIISFFPFTYRSSWPRGRMTKGSD